MIEKMTTEREQIWVSLDTGEVAETHDEAMALYRDGHELQIQYRYAYNGVWGGWNYGPQWVH